MKTRRRLRQTILEEATQNTQDDEMQEAMAMKEEAVVQNFEQEPLTYENLILCHWTKVFLPSSLWAVHRESTGKCIAFSCLSENTSDTYVSTDKIIMFEGSLKTEIFIRGRKVEPSSLVQQNVETIETMNALLKEVDQLDLCKGTGLDNALYSPECCLILDRKYRNSRCSNCAMKRTHLKKTEAQRLRRAAAKQKEPVKNILGSRKQSKNKEMEYLDDGSGIEVSGMEDLFDKQDQHFTDEGENEKLQNFDEKDEYG